MELQMATQVFQGLGLFLEATKGHFLMVGVKKLPIGTNNIAECQETLLAVRLAIKEGIKRIHLEADSLIIVQAISKLSVNAWYLQSIINLIEKELNNFEDFKISHIRREGNKEANMLSNGH